MNLLSLRSLLHPILLYCAMLIRKARSVAGLSSAGMLQLLFAFAAMASLSGAQAQVVTYFHNDASGTPMLATDAVGAVLWRETYQPYGDRINRSAASTNNSLWFAGKPHDDNAGLSYMGARYYDPLLGRFAGIDPADVDPDNLHSFNRYAYANNNPYKFVDPDGHSPIDIAFLVYDLGKLGRAAYTGVGVSGALIDVASSVVGVASPIPGTGQAIKAARAASIGIRVARAAVLANEGTKSDDKREVKIDDKIQGQLGGRGWTEAEVRNLANTKPTGTTTDNRGGNKTPDGNKRNDPASVYGPKDGGHIIVNDVTGEVLQVSDKQPGWVPDSRIDWK